MLTAEQREALEKPLDQSIVKTRRQGNRQVPYMPQHAAKRTMNEVFLPAGWSYTFPYGPPVMVGQGIHTADDGKEGVHTAYTAVVRLRVGDAEYDEVGYGDAVEYGQDAKRTTHELALKECVSDAFKRCAMNLGDRLGLALWDKDSDTFKEAVTQDGRKAEPVANESQIKKIMAEAGEIKLSDDERHRIVRFITRGRTQSVKELRRSEVTLVLDGFAFYNKQPGDASAQMAEWEAANGLSEAANVTAA